MMLLARILIFALGMACVIVTMQSAVVTFVLPRGAIHIITSTAFRLIRRLFDFFVHWAKTYEARDRIMALYAPVALLSLVPLWMLLVLLGYAAMFWATGLQDPARDFLVSGSSLFTLGFATGDNVLHTTLAFSEAAIGLMLVALLISYLPTMYSAFSARELAVNQLSVRAGTPPSATELLLRANRIGALDELRDLWEQWETWFAGVEETHTSLAALIFFRSPQPYHSWVTAAGTVLDSAALLQSTLAVANQPQGALCIRAGYLCLRRIVELFDVTLDPAPHFPETPISITRAEFDAVYDELQSKGVPLKADREQAWLDFAGWRVNYDRNLLVLCTLTMAPPAQWSTDRAPAYKPVPIFSRKPRKVT